MNNTYVFDACSLIAMLKNEKGTDVVKGLLQKAANNELTIVMHKINFLEVYYYTYKRNGESSALELFKGIKLSPIKIDTDITDDILIKAGRFKSLYKISLADSIGLAETIIYGGYFVTADHHELDVVEKKENLNIIWIR
jgi:predicted nucleic acid-binding protein